MAGVAVVGTGDVPDVSFQAGMRLVGPREIPVRSGPSTVPRYIPRLARYVGYVVDGNP